MGFRQSVRPAAVAAAFALAGCSGGGGDGGGSATGTLSVSLMDAPVDGVASVHVEIAKLWLKPAGEGPAVELPLANAPLRVNLLELRDDNAAVLIDGASVPAGEYEWLAMDVNAEFDNVLDSYVMTAIGGQEELRVPSGRVRLVSGFEVAPNQAVRLLVDWDLRAALVNPGGQPGYLLRPAFRVLHADALGILTGTVSGTLVGPGCEADDPNDLAVGNVVYVFPAGATPNDLDDVDGADVEPVAFADAVQTPTSGADFEYRVALAPGAYDIAFTCLAGNDDPEAEGDVLDFTDAVSVEVTTAAPTVVDLPPAP
ncbi:MAG TPA: DUF4382 domain-containing protein [Gammaproteobacteria bacterium]